MQSKTKLKWTTDYDKFELHNCNRPERPNKKLERLIRENGFNGACPLHVVRNSHDKFLIIQGHHRFKIAERLKIPFAYIEADIKMGIFDLEGSARKWSAEDFAEAYSHAGKEDYDVLLKFKADHKLPMGSAAALVNGRSAASMSAIEAVKAGTFKVVGNMRHAYSVADITDRCARLGVKFARTTSFVSAVSLALRVPEVDREFLIGKLKKYGDLMSQCKGKEEYLDELQTVYNRGTRDRKQVAIRFRALQLAKQRRASYFKTRNK